MAAPQQQGAPGFEPGAFDAAAAQQQQQAPPLGGYPGGYPGGYGGYGGYAPQVTGYGGYYAPQMTGYGPASTALVPVGELAVAARAWGGFWTGQAGREAAPCVRGPRAPAAVRGGPQHPPPHPIICLRTRPSPLAR
jgi:hypothetical protein